MPGLGINLHRGGVEVETSGKFHFSQLSLNFQFSHCLPSKINCLKIFDKEELFNFVIFTAMYSMNLKCRLKYQCPEIFGK